MRNRDTPANGEYKKVNECAIQKGGMTKREKAAIAAMQGIMASSTSMNPDGSHFAKIAVKMADALFDELEKGDE